MAGIAVVGPGAIGAAVAAAVESTGRHELIVCARRPRDALVVERDGTGAVALRAPVVTDPRDVAPVDWLLLAVKAHQTDGAGDWLRRLTRPETTVVVLQNGVRHRELVEPFVGDAAIVPASIWLGAELADGRVRVRGESRIRVPDDEHGRGFAALLAGSWISVEPIADFPSEAWRKLCINALAGLMALTGRRAAMFRDADIAELADRLALECAAVARAEGAKLCDEDALGLAAALAAAPPDSGTSILFDRERGAPLEWQARNGVIRELGRVHDIPTPVSDVVVPLLAAASGDAVRTDEPRARDSAARP